jgi:hypothetical protein
MCFENITTESKNSIYTIYVPLLLSHSLDFFFIVLLLTWQLDDIPLKLSLYSESNIIRSGAVVENIMLQQHNIVFE